MSSRPQFSPQIVIPSSQAQPASTGSMAANIISAPTIIQKLSMVSYSLSWSGSSPVGTASVQLSNDYSQNSDGSVNNPGTWNTMTLQVGGSSVTSIPISGNSGNGFIDITDCAAYAIRLIYSATSGTGTLQAIVNGKVS